MFYISQIKLRNFKSFKNAVIHLSPNFVCLAGPNGSGKSNICDAIRFALGELSFKALRAKGTKDLIFIGSKSADVTIYFDGEEKLEIKKSIDEDGKSTYRLNGKKTTRTAILEALRRHNLDSSGRNIIAQGEVNKIIEMSGKERRQYIDAVAGISEFEEKKNEALKDLEVVENRIKEANLILGERKGYLQELEREKEDALRYKEAKEQRKKARATLLQMEIERFAKEKKKTKDREAELLKELEAYSRSLLKLEDEIHLLENRRTEINKKIQESRQLGGMVGRIEDLKARVASLNEKLRAKEENLSRLKERKGAVKKEIDLEEKKLKEIENEIAQISKELSLSGEDKEASSEKGKTKEERELLSLKENLESLSFSLRKLTEAQGKAEAEINALASIIDMKERELAEIKEKTAKTFSSKENTELESLKEEVKNLDRELDSIFNREREINRMIAEIDKEILKLQEKASQLRAEASKTRLNPAIAFVQELKKDGFPGIYGPVFELIKFDNKYAKAIEAGAGGRISYIVVDSAATAEKIIRELKKSGAGRASFIPLREIRVSEVVNNREYPSLLSVIDFPQEVRKAMEYVFGDTLLVPDMPTARKLGVGKFRMVTLDGESFEKSGVIFGGHSKSNVLLASQLQKILLELNEQKKKRESLFSELHNLRERSHRKRAEKSRIEVDIKALEIEAKSREEKKKELLSLKEKEKALENELNELRTKLSERKKNLSVLLEDISRKEEESKDLKERIKEKEDEFMKKFEEEHKALTEKAKRRAELRTRKEEKEKELSNKKSYTKRLRDDLSEIEKEITEIEREVSEIEKELFHSKKELEEAEKELSKRSRKTESLFSELKEIDEKIKALGEERGQISFKSEKVKKELQSISLKLASLDTKLSDLKSEFELLKDKKPFEGKKKEELLEILRNAESLLESLGDRVNLAAIEAYERRKKEIEEVEAKIAQLKEERKAILDLIDEIDKKKRDAFFDAFYAINDIFKSMFDYPAMKGLGKGYLYLDKPNDPFQSGLNIKLKRGGKEYPLIGLSGGERSLLALIFAFALQFYKPSPFYILDEVDAAFDKENSKQFASLLREMAEKGTQFIVVTHDDVVISMAESVVGVTKVDGTSKIVGVRLVQENK